MVPVFTMVDEPPNSGLPLTDTSPVSRSNAAHVTQPSPTQADRPANHPTNTVNLNLNLLQPQLPQAAPPDRRLTHTWINFFEDGSRPCDAFPRPYRSGIDPTLLEVSKDISMRDFLARLGTPQQAGFGVQQVFPQEGGVWGSGQIFEWGVGRPKERLGSTELGRGVQGREVWVAKWARNN